MYNVQYNYLFMQGIMAIQLCGAFLIIWSPFETPLKITSKPFCKISILARNMFDMNSK